MPRPRPSRSPSPARRLEPACEYVSADDPYERYQDYGYHVRGYLHDGDPDTQKTYTYLDFDNKGTLKEVSYIAEIDPTRALRTTSPASSSTWTSFPLSSNP